MITIIAAMCDMFMVTKFIYMYFFVCTAPGRVTGVQASYPYVVWNPPEQPNGVITGYRLTFTRGSSRTVTTNTDIPHYRITSANIPGTSGPLSVTVSY